MPDPPGPDVQRRQRVGFTVMVLGGTEEQVMAVARHLYDHALAPAAAAAAEEVGLRHDQVLPVPVSDFRNVDTIYRLRAGTRVRHRHSGWAGSVVADVERDDEQFQGGTVDVRPEGGWRRLTVTIDELEVLDG